MSVDGGKERSITELLRRWRHGDRDAETEALEVLYGELRKIALGYCRHERPSHTLQATAIVHEAYLRLVDEGGAQFVDRRHFLGFAARVMRRVLVDHARERAVAKRGGGQQHVTLVEAADLGDDRPADLVAVDEALSALAEVDPRKAQVVELRFFGGLTMEEIGEHLGISRATAIRDWRGARAWLYLELRGDDAPTDDQN